jgi:hypothetical protein
MASEIMPIESIVSSLRGIRSHMLGFISGTFIIISLSRKNSKLGGQGFEHSLLSKPQDVESKSRPPRSNICFLEIDSAFTNNLPIYPLIQ